jgi:TolB-like protein
MTGAIITGLAQLLPLKVISRTSVVGYRGTQKSLPQIGEELRVDEVALIHSFSSGFVRRRKPCAPVLSSNSPTISPEELIP